MDSVGSADAFVEHGGSGTRSGLRADTPEQRGTRTAPTRRERVARRTRREVPARPPARRRRVCACACVCVRVRACAYYDYFYYFFFFFRKNPKWVLRRLSAPSLCRTVRARPAGQSRRGRDTPLRRRRRRRFSPPPGAGTRRPSATTDAAGTPASDPCGRGAFGAGNTHAHIRGNVRTLTDAATVAAARRPLPDSVC